MLYILMGMALVEALTLGYARIEHNGKVTALAARDVAVADLTSYRNRQRDYIGKLVLEGVAAADHATQTEKELANERKTAATRYADVAGRLPGRDAPIAAPVVGLLNDAIRAANAGKDAAIAAPKSSESPAPAATDTGALIDWSLVCIDRYREARDEIIEFQLFYNRLRDAQHE